MGTLGKSMLRISFRFCETYSNPDPWLTTMKKFVITEAQLSTTGGHHTSQVILCPHQHTMNKRYLLSFVFRITVSWHTFLNKIKVLSCIYVKFPCLTRFTIKLQFTAELIFERLIRFYF